MTVINVLHTNPRASVRTYPKLNSTYKNFFVGSHLSGITSNDILILRFQILIIGRCI